jgi:nucleoporin POM152
MLRSLTIARSALLNPENEVFCLSGTSSQVQLPIQINQTIPYLIELLRQDFDGDTWEVISIKSSEAKKMRKVALKQQKPVEAHDPLLLRYAVKKPGRYTIGKIVDESQLEVRPRISEIFVVSCPSARIKPLRPNRCRGDLSDIAFAVEGTPPLKIKYRKSVNGNSMEASFQGIQPEDFTSPLARRQNTDLARSDWVDVAWAGQKEVIVPVNETMSTVGKYKYTIEEVQDALGNKVVYSKASDEDDKENYKTSDTKKIIVVDDRPVIWVPRQASCNAERPLKVAKGKAAQLPHKITSVGRTEKEVEMSRKDDYPFLEDHVIEYEFIPEKSLSNANSSENDRRLLKLTKRSSSMPIPIQEPGLYTLMSIRTDHCQGEVSEPSSCLLQNPIEPTVKIDSAGISDKCAGNPVGLRLTFDFEGSPPFTVKYLSEQEGQKTINYYSQQFPGLRGQLELVPPEAGHYSYKFTEVKDQYYESIPLQDLELSHDVKPSASAQIEYPPQGGLNLCKGDPAIFNIKLSGEAPWTLEYEVIHGKSRKKDRITEINTPTYTLVLNDLGDGGEYTLQVTSVTDKTNCKEFLKLEQPFHIWSQRPTASFGEIEGKRAVHVLEGKSLRLPLRFTGQNAFNYVIKHQESGEDFTQSSAHASGVFEVSKRGTYEILTVQDVHCPGVVDEGSNKFTMDWIGRPSLSLAQSPTVELKKSKYTKQDVCEGDEDYVELAFQGM